MMTCAELYEIVMAMGGWTSASRQLGVHPGALRVYAQDELPVPKKVVDKVIELQSAGSFKYIGKPYVVRVNTPCPSPVRMYGGSGELVYQRDD